MRFARILYYLGCLTIAQIAVRPVLNTALSDLLFFAALLALAPALLMRGKTVPFNLPRNLIGGVLLFVLGTSLSLFWVDDPDVLRNSTVVLLKFTYMCVIWFWLSSVIFTAMDQLKTALVCIAVSCAVSAIYGIYETLYLLEYAWYRTAGMADHTNQFGATCAIGMTMVFGFLFRPPGGAKRPRWVQASFLLLFLACGLGLVVSKSLGSFFALFIGFLTWLVIQGIKPRYVLFLGAVGLIVTAALVIQHSTSEYSVLDRFERQTDLQDRDASLTTRLSTYATAFDEILDNPFIGQGLEVTTSTGFMVHNSLLKSLYESGILGIAGLIMIYLAVLRLGVRTLRLPVSGSDQQIAANLLVSFVVYLAISMKEPLLYNRFGWVAAALLLSFWTLGRQRPGRRPVGGARTPLSTANPDPANRPRHPSGPLYR